MSTRPIYLNLAEEITKRIVSGEFPIGSRLPSERELSDLFSTSRGSLREALHILERQKIIQSYSGGSRFILRDQPVDESTDTLYNQLENAAVADLLEARETLDDILLTLACQRCTDEDMADIDRAYDKMQEWEKTSPVLLDAGDLFHLSIAKAAHNSVFVSIYSANLEIFRKIRSTTLQVPGRRKEMMQEHIEIYKAIKERDALAARLAARIHLRNIRRRYDSIQDKSLIDLQHSL